MCSETIGHANASMAHREGGNPNSFENLQPSESDVEIYDRCLRNPLNPVLLKKEVIVFEICSSGKSCPSWLHQRLRCQVLQ